MNPQPETTIVKAIETLTADQPFEVEITGPRTANTAIVMVHGFGVKRDSRGMFTEIESAICKHHLSLRPELSLVGTFGTKALPFSLQAERLSEVFSFVEESFSPESTVLIGHSQGNLVIAKSQPINSKIIMLAPPADFEKFIETDGWKRPASHLDLEGASKLVRSDLTIEVPPQFWAEFRSTDATALYSHLAQTNEVTIVVPEDDNALGSTEIPADLRTLTLPGAGHDFTGESRKELVELLLREI